MPRFFGRYSVYLRKKLAVMDVERLRKAFGRPLKFEDANELWEKALEYFKWASENPWMKAEAVKGGQMAGEVVYSPTERPFHIGSFCVHTGIVHQTFLNYKARGGEFLEVCTRIEEICKNQKFEGATVGAYNANIIARDLGLGEHVDHTTKGEKITNEPDYSKLSPSALKELKNAGRSNG